MTIHKDTHGNQYRETSEGWQVMRPGVGWTVFNNDAPITLDDGTVIPAKEAEPEGYTEAEKSFILSHARDVHLQAVAAVFQADRDDTSPSLARMAMRDAKALAAELKKEGVL